MPAQRRCVFLLLILLLIWIIWLTDKYFSPEETPLFKSFSTFKIPPNRSTYILWEDNLTGTQTRIPLRAKEGDVFGIGVLDREDQTGKEIQNIIQERKWVPDTLPASISKRTLSKGAIDSRAEISEIENRTVIRSRFNFFYEFHNHPTLKLLREREGLREVIEGEEEFAQFIKLMHWVHKQWKASSPDPYPPWNAVLVLNMIRGGETGGFCTQYAQVLVQSLLSFGYQARYISIKNHVVVEVWSNKYQKWIALDPHRDVYYQENDTPLNAWEIYSIVMGGKTDSIEVRGNISPDVAQEEISKYESFAVHFKNNHLSEPQSPAKDFNDFWKSSVILIDEYTKKLPFESGRISLVTSDINDLYFNLNTVEIKEIKSLSGSAYQVVFDTFTPGFDSYIIKIDEEKERECRDANGFKWTLKAGINRLKVKTKNRAGILGPWSSIVVKYNDQI